LNFKFSHRNWRCSYLIFIRYPSIQLFLDRFTSWKHRALGITLYRCRQLWWVCLLDFVRLMSGTTACWVPKATTFSLKFEVISSRLHVSHVLFVVRGFCDESSSHSHGLYGMRTKLVIEHVHLLSCWSVIQNIFKDQHDFLAWAWWNSSCIGTVHLAFSSGSTCTFDVALEFMFGLFESSTGLETCLYKSVTAWTARLDFSRRFGLEISLIFHGWCSCFSWAHWSILNSKLSWILKLQISVVYTRSSIPVKSKHISRKSTIMLSQRITSINVVASRNKLQVW